MPNIEVPEFTFSLFEDSKGSQLYFLQSFFNAIFWLLTCFICMHGQLSGFISDNLNPLLQLILNNTPDRDSLSPKIPSLSVHLQDGGDRSPTLSPCVQLLTQGRLETGSRKGCLSANYYSALFPLVNLKTPSLTSSFMRAFLFLQPNGVASKFINFLIIFLNLRNFHMPFSSTLNQQQNAFLSHFSQRQLLGHYGKQNTAPDWLFCLHSNNR